MKLCFDFHKDQVDKGGMPYVFHPWYVADQMETETETVTALLHDTIEDGLDMDTLRAANINPWAFRAILAITRKKSETYAEYIDRVTHNITAARVKRQDLLHNMDTSRLPEGKTVSLERYKNAYNKIVDSTDYIIPITHIWTETFNKPTQGTALFEAIQSHKNEHPIQLVKLPSDLEEIEEAFMGTFVNLLVEEYGSITPEKIRIYVPGKPHLTQKFENAIQNRISVPAYELIESAIAEFNQ